MSNSSSMPLGRVSLLLFASCLSLTLSAITGATAAETGRTHELFDAGWKFARFGPQPDGRELAEPTELQQAAADDAGWLAVDLPHDWGIAGPFRQDLPNNTGKLPWAGVGWYRKRFTLPAADRDKRIVFEFEGAMSQPEIFINGQKAGEWKYGYASFHVDATPLVKFGQENVIAVRLDNPPSSSRWYPGGGLYRHVWLLKRNAVGIEPWGVFFHTPKVSVDSTEAVVEVEVGNATDAVAKVDVQCELRDDQGEVVAKAASKSVEVPARGVVKAVATMTVEKPRLWEFGQGNLYHCVAIVSTNGAVVDEVTLPVGIRHVQWSAQQGFVLNGKPVKLNGVCQHHDLGPLGSASHDEAISRQLDILQEMGVNAIRTSHNPPAPFLLAECDRRGIVVLDELFDSWKRNKTRNDYHRYFEAWHERDVTNFVHRDRNHPCVVAWSSGNEIREQDAAGDSLQISQRLTELFHREDPTRVVTAGCNQESAMFNGFSETLDVMGLNYKAVLAKTPNYETQFQRHPEQPAYGSETASCVSSRGEYFFPVSDKQDGGFEKFQVSAYEMFAPSWGYRPDVEFDSQDRMPALGGEFVWTGFDYLGEPTPYNDDSSIQWNFTDPEARKKMTELYAKLGKAAPSRSSYFGIVDLCGFKKDRFYLYQSQWRPELPMVHILPHWTWPDRIGAVTPVHVFTSGDEVELFLNGKSLGRKKKGEREYRLRWDDVKYEPGELRAVAYKRGAKWAETTVRTTGPAVRIDLEVHGQENASDGLKLKAGSLAFVTVKIVDERGDVVPTASNRLRFQVDGPGRFLAADNGDATCLETMSTPERNAFHGLALAIVASAKDAGGGPAALKLRVQADGLQSAEATFAVGK